MNFDDYGADDIISKACKHLPEGFKKRPTRSGTKSPGLWLSFEEFIRMVRPWAKKLKLKFEIVPSSYDLLKRRMLLTGDTQDKVLSGSKRRLYEFPIERKVTYGFSPKDVELFCHVFHVDPIEFHKHADKDPF